MKEHVLCPPFLAPAPSSRKMRASYCQEQKESDHHKNKLYDPGACAVPGYLSLAPSPAAILQGVRSEPVTWLLPKLFTPSLAISGVQATIVFHLSNCYGLRPPDVSQL